MGSIIQMLATVAGGTENALAQIDVPLPGFIEGVEWNGDGTFDTTLDFARLQLSFGSVGVFTNDARQVISNVYLGRAAHVTAAGIVLAVASLFVRLPDLVVAMGERLYLHSVASATTVCQVNCLVHFSFDQDKPSVRRR
jgi:hypothetical protein